MTQLNGSPRPTSRNPSIHHEILFTFCCFDLKMDSFEFNMAKIFDGRESRELVLMMERKFIHAGGESCYTIITGKFLRNEILYIAKINYTTHIYSVPWQRLSKIVVAFTFFRFNKLHWRRCNDVFVTFFSGMELGFRISLQHSTFREIRVGNYTRKTHIP